MNSLTYLHSLSCTVTYLCINQWALKPISASQAVPGNKCYKHLTTWCSLTVLFPIGWGLEGLLCDCSQCVLWYSLSLLLQLITWWYTNTHTTFLILGAFVAEDNLNTSMQSFLHCDSWLRGDGGTEANFSRALTQGKWSLCSTQWMFCVMPTFQNSNPPNCTFQEQEVQ